jgi:hypothetical protein
LFEVINETGIGPQGLGGDTTALGVHIESAWTPHHLQPRGGEFAMLARGKTASKNFRWR